IDSTYVVEGLGEAPRGHPAGNRVSYVIVVMTVQLRIHIRRRAVTAFRSLAHPISRRTPASAARRLDAQDRAGIDLYGNLAWQDVLGTIRLDQRVAAGLARRA